MAKVKEVYFYATKLKRKDWFDAHMILAYIDQESGKAVAIESIDKARELAREKHKNKWGETCDSIYGVMFEEEFEDE